MTVLTWMFEQIGAWGGSTGQAWKDILVSVEDLTKEGRLVREASQNANDAHDKKSRDPAVRVRITRKVLPARELAKMVKFLRLESELEKRLPSLGLSADNALSKMLKGKGEVEITIFEDFNTVGLGGALNTHGFDAAVWTALGKNLEEKTREPFSVNAAIRYLEACNRKTLDAALTYIRQAPPEVRTPVRDAVNVHWPARAKLSIRPTG
jgi:hypothetical protein